MVNSNLFNQLLVFYLYFQGLFSVSSFLCYKLGLMKQIQEKESHLLSKSNRDTSDVAKFRNKILQLHDSWLSDLVSVVLSCCQANHNVIKAILIVSYINFI